VVPAQGFATDVRRPIFRLWALAGLASVLALIALPACTNPLSRSCTVGYADTDLNVTVEGWNANSRCDQLIADTGSSKTNGQAAVGAGYYSNPTGTLVCRYDVQGYTVTVRDQGMLKLLGNAACQSLQQRAVQQPS
jgi:hypothetical protein